MAALSVGAQCEGDPKVSFELLLPASLGSEAQWLELGVLPGACPPQAELAGGIPASGAVARVAFQSGDTSPPAIGALKKASYAFAAAARGADCTVLATGCTAVDVTQARDVSVSMQTTGTGAGACGAGEVCADGRCVPASDPDDPSLGAGCSLQLVAAGPFAVPLDDFGEMVSAPAVAVTESGFLVAYREYDPGPGQAQLTVAAIDEGGALSVPTPTVLAAQCAGQDETDAVGLAYLGGAGVVLSARPPCISATSTGLDVLQVDPGGNVLQSAFDTTPGAPGLSNAHAVSLTSASAGWVAYLADGAPNVVALSGLQTPGAPVAFGGARPQILAEVAATGQAVALLSGDGSTLGLSLAASPSADAGAPLSLTASWGALAAEGARAFVFSDSADGSHPVAVQAFDQGGSQATVGVAFAPPGTGVVAGGDITVQGDRAYFAVEQEGSISVVVYDHASTSPTFLRSALLASDPRIPSQLEVRDGRVAIAASSTRVLVAWITAATLGPDDPVGAYALYACAP